MRQIFVRVALTTPNGSCSSPQFVDSVRRMFVESPDVATALLLARVVAEQRRAGMSVSKVVEISGGTLSADASPPAIRVAGALRLIDELINDGDVAAAGAVCEGLSMRVPTNEANSLRHRLACRSLDLEAANAAIAALGHRHSGTPEHAEQSASFGDTIAIAAAPEGIRSTRVRRALLDIGRLNEASRLTGATDLSEKVEILVLGGEVDAARSSVEEHIDAVGHDLGFLRTAHFVARAVGPALVEAVHAAVVRGESTTQSHRVRSLAELALPEEAIEHGGQKPTRDLNVHAIYTLAQAHYALGNFSPASSLLGQLAGSVRHADAHKLAARVLLEQGQFDEALRHRHRHGVPSRDLDEVVHHSLVGLGRYPEAFAAYCPLGTRLDGHFAFPTQRPWAGPDRRPFRSTDHVFVVAQSGPGDEIQMAMAYTALVAMVGSVTCSVDPRLHVLFARSFPSISFVPTTRRSQALHWGFLAKDQPARHASNLAPLLDAESGEIAARANRIVFARELPGSLGLTEAPPQSGPFLRPLPRTRSLPREGFEHKGPAVGIVWRSELSSMMRSIHYMELPHLESLFATDLNFVCLQHDTTEGERAWLESRLGGRISFVSDVDLRDDLDGAASLISSLDAVVGVGTTLVELAGAVGTPTVILQPNHFGTWRSIDSDHHDFWYRNVRVAAQPGEMERSQLGKRSVNLLSSLRVC